MKTRPKGNRKGGTLLLLLLLHAQDQRKLSVRRGG